MDCVRRRAQSIFWYRSKKRWKEKIKTHPAEEFIIAEYKPKSVAQMQAALKEVFDPKRRNGKLSWLPSGSAKFGQNIPARKLSGNVVLPTLNSFLSFRRRFVKLCTQPMRLRRLIPVLARWQNAALFLNDYSVFKLLYLRVVDLQKNWADRPIANWSLGKQSVALERPPRFTLRQIRSLIFPTYTICLTLPNIP